tara:strand:+ start:794 stop:931 length:138 start_codon:yes stop_codon:yes gene_type:complete
LQEEVEFDKADVKDLKTELLNEKKKLREQVCFSQASHKVFNKIIV